MIDPGRRRRDEDNANGVSMGWAGMAQYRDPLEQSLGIPVVEPSQAAASMAIGRITLGQSHRTKGS
jgi:Asp/Glu/hydantoin racemase